MEYHYFSKVLVWKTFYEILTFNESIRVNLILDCARKNIRIFHVEIKEAKFHQKLVVISVLEKSYLTFVKCYIDQFGLHLMELHNEKVVLCFHKGINSLTASFNTTIK